MNRMEQLRIEAIAMKQALLDEGFLGRAFLTTEEEPLFVEDIIRLCLTTSTSFLDKLKEALITKPMNIQEVGRLIHKVKGSCANIGAAYMDSTVDRMLALFHSKNIDRLYAAYMDVRDGHNILILQLEPYAELLRMLREEQDDFLPPDEASVNLMTEDTAESVDSNENSQ